MLVSDERAVDNWVVGPAGAPWGRPVIMGWHGAGDGEVGSVSRGHGRVNRSDRSPRWRRTWWFPTAVMVVLVSFVAGCASWFEPSPQVDPIPSAAPPPPVAFMCLPLMMPQATLFPDVEDFGDRLEATRTAADRQALGREVLDRLTAIGFFGAAPTPKLTYAPGSPPITFGTRTIGQYTWHDNTITLYETAFTRGPSAFLAAIVHESTHALQPAPSSKQARAELEVDAALAEIRWAGL